MLGFLKKKRSVVLVLGGGSARGLAHIGVLKVLEKEKIPIHRIVGTSMGALIGAAYSVGMPLKKMEDMAHKFNWKTVFDPTLPHMGLLKGKKLAKVVSELTDGKSFNECKIPLAVVTTDIEKNERVVFQKGDLQKVVCASCSWPGIFNPIRIDGRLLVDGGIKNSVPTRIARSIDPGYMVAVDVGFCVKEGKIDNIFQMLLQSFQIMGEELNRYQARISDVMIKVELGHNIDQVAFNRSREAIAKGEKAAEEKAGQIKRMLSVYNFPSLRMAGQEEWKD
ncbi:MAG: patatin-like phospholipase family protein [Candidatus Omnitrophota bacterium]|nr:patatin-like phospholipase family protein [Candidatus Omnitrophota bacterium]